MQNIQCIRRKDLNNIGIHAKVGGAAVATIARAEADGREGQGQEKKNGTGLLRRCHERGIEWRVVLYTTFANGKFMVEMRPGSRLLTRL